MTGEQRSGGAAVRLVVVATVAVYLALAAAQLNQLFVIDEIEFPRLAQAISETGKPVYYRGEENPQHTGTFHPPLYAYALGGWIAATGYSETSVRVFGVLLMAGTAALGYRTLRFLGLKSTWSAVGFLVIFLFYPYTIQSALLPDIDGTVLLFASMLLLHELSRRLTRPEVPFLNFVIGVGAVVGLNLWAKLTSFPIFLVVLFALLVTQRPRRALLLAVSSLAIGVAAFVVSWALVAAVIGTRFAYPFEFTVQSGLKGGLGESSLGELLARLLPVDSTRYWLGWVLPVLLVWGIAMSLKRWRTGVEARLLVVYGCWALGVFALYSILTNAPFGFPKYYISAVPVAAILAMVPIGEGLDRLRKPLVSIAFFLTIVVVLGATIYWFGTPPVDLKYHAPGIMFWTVCVVIALLVLALALWRDKAHPRWVQGVVSLGLFGVLTGYGLGLSWHQAYREESVRYFPEEVGFEAVVSRMGVLLEDGEAFLAPKDVGSATTNRYYQEESLFPRPVALVETLQNPQVRYAVVRITWDYSYLIFPEAEALIEDAMDVQETVGDFIIYRRAG